MAAALATLTACTEDEPESLGWERTDTTQDHLVSAPVELGTFPLATMWDAQWQCGVGLLTWVESEPTTQRVMAIRFDASGSLLDPAPFLVLEMPSVSILALERSNQGFLLLYKTVLSFPQPGNTHYAIHAIPITTTGQLQPSVLLASTQATSFYIDPSSRSLHLSGTGFDGQDAYALIVRSETGSTPQQTSSMASIVREDGLGVTLVNETTLGASSFPLIRGFGCGFGRCLVLTRKQSFNTETDSLYAGLDLLSQASGMTSPIGSGSVIALESCEFLVGSKVVDGTSVVAGPHPLAGAELFRAHDGEAVRRYHLEGGEPFSHGFAADGSPTPVQAEPGLLLGSIGANRPVGDGKMMRVVRDGANTFSLQFVGTNALVDVPGHCDPIGDPGLSSGATPDCVDSVGQGEPCVSNAQCDSGACVDGVCCESECAGGTSDCLACSIAAGGSANGLCTPRVANTVCRVGDPITCNGTEVCDGVSSACPPDGPSPDGTPCILGFCTEAACEAGECVALPNACDDGSSCTVDYCLASHGCYHEYSEQDNGAACDVANPCASGSCLLGECLESPVPQGTPCPGGTCNGLVCEPEGGGGGGPGGGGEGAQGGTSDTGGSSEDAGGGSTGSAGQAGDGPTRGDSGGCACATSNAQRAGWWPLVAAFALGVRMRRSRRRSSTDSASR